MYTPGKRLVRSAQTIVVLELYYVRIEATSESQQDGLAPLTQLFVGILRTYGHARFSRRQLRANGDTQDRELGTPS